MLWGCTKTATIQVELIDDQLLKKYINRTGSLLLFAASLPLLLPILFLQFSPFKSIYILHLCPKSSTLLHCSAMSTHYWRNPSFARVTMPIIICNHKWMFSSSSSALSVKINGCYCQDPHFQRDNKFGVSNGDDDHQIQNILPKIIISIITTILKN